MEILLIVLMAYAVSRLFFRTATMQDSSMEPTISVGNTILLDKAAYRIHSPRRGDLIAYRLTDDDTEILHIKPEDIGGFQTGTLVAIPRFS